MRVLFLLAAFVSSALLFIVEPMAAKIILPTFGGTPQVWNGALLFFQTTLLLGYLYAHLSAQRLSAGVQRAVHPIVAGVAAIVAIGLPLSVHNGIFLAVQRMAAHGGDPLILVLLALGGLVGLPFLALSANSSMLQRWYSLSGQPDAAQPWFLYSAGNVGSMLALLSYPSLVEPHLTLSQQGRWWSVGFAVLIVLLIGCAVASSRSRSKGVVAEPVIPETEAGIPAVDEAPTAPTPVDRKLKLTWLGLAAVPSSLLLGVTTYITSNIAPVPLLWVIPLALYLLTFILVFARRPITPAYYLGRVYSVLLPPLVLIIVLEASTPGFAIIHLVVFFVACWMCHARLALMKPSAEHLTEYFLMISLGGVLGGAFNAIVAPNVFNTLAEYPAGLVAVAMLMPKIMGGKTKSWGLDAGYPAAVAGIMIVLVLVARAFHMDASSLRTFLTIGSPTILCFLAVDSPTRFGLSIAAAFLVAGGMHVASDGVVPFTARSFFGVHRILVTENGRFHKLYNGNTMHGVQDTQHPETPLSYYYPTGPIGEFMKAVHPPTAAFVGLGVGSLAAYGRPGDRYTFYEIDPVVRQIATDPKWFTFVRDSAAKVNIVLGDARLELATSPDKYDLIVLDAFSSDAIPIHLLTEDAVKMYLQHLQSHGVLAFHISNRFLALEPVLSAIERDLHLVGYAMIDGSTTDEKAAGKQDSHWVLLAPDKLGFGTLKLNWWSDLDPPNKRAWTDDYSNILGAFSTED